MALSDAKFAGSIPELYDRLLVPLIFAPYAQDLAERAAALRPREVLEVAAGTGAVTRALAAALPAARIVATDLNEPMLRHAESRQGANGRVAWQTADAQALPFAEQSFDLVVCQFGAMFFPDKTRAYAEARRVLRPGGRYLFNVWDAIADNEFADAVTQALERLFPHDPPRFLARTPHGYHDAARIRAELTAAGFGEVSIAALEKTSRAASPLEPAQAYCQGTPLRNEIEARDAARLEEATRLAAAALAERFGRGEVAGRIRALVIAATR